MRILEIAHATTEELGSMPRCDVGKLERLADEYLNSVGRVKKGMNEQKDSLKLYKPYGEGNYALKRSVQIAEAAAHLESEYLDISKKVNFAHDYGNSFTLYNLLMFCFLEVTCMCDYQCA